MTTGKTIALALCIFLSAKWCPYFFIHWFVIAFLPRSKCLLISWLQSPSTVVLEPRKIKICHCFHFFPIYLPLSRGTRCYDLLFFECWVLSQLFHSPLSPSSKGSLVPLHFLLLEWYHLHIEVVDISSSNLDSSLCFIQPSISHNVLCIEVK